MSFAPQTEITIKALFLLSVRIAAALNLNRHFYFENNLNWSQLTDDLEFCATCSIVSCPVDINKIWPVSKAGRQCVIQDSVALSPLCGTEPPSFFCTAGQQHYDIISDLSEKSRQ